MVISSSNVWRRKVRELVAGVPEKRWWDCVKDDMKSFGWPSCDNAQNKDD